ncbi:unnamed protein product [Prorocentrum cordatum]|uniref:Protein kinase domain-containing protein n=1 Tax=Prorocentrum cordatum TaxID=2364126 RepID=A0ABN9YGJ9_9DINO|nr:unnamed protein product [Polarella glacialis]
MSGDIFGLKKRKSGSGGDIFGLKGREKRSKTEAADAQPRNSLQHSSSFDERADLLGDLLEEDRRGTPSASASDPAFAADGGVFGEGEGPECEGDGIDGAVEEITSLGPGHLASYPVEIGMLAAMQGRCDEGEKVDLAAIVAERAVKPRRAAGGQPPGSREKARIKGNQGWVPGRGAGEAAPTTPAAPAALGGAAPRRAAHLEESGAEQASPRARGGPAKAGVGIYPALKRGHPRMHDETIEKYKRRIFGLPQKAMQLIVEGAQRLVSSPQKMTGEPDFKNNHGRGPAGYTVDPQARALPLKLGELVESMSDLDDVAGHVVTLGIQTPNGDGKVFAVDGAPLVQGAFAVGEKGAPLVERRPERTFISRELPEAWQGRAALGEMVRGHMVGAPGKAWTRAFSGVRPTGWALAAALLLPLGVARLPAEERRKDRSFFICRERWHPFYIDDFGAPEVAPGESAPSRDGQGGPRWSRQRASYTRAGIPWVIDKCHEGQEVVERIGAFVDGHAGVVSAPQATLRSTLRLAVAQVTQVCGVQDSYHDLPQRGGRRPALALAAPITRISSSRLSRLGRVSAEIEGILRGGERQTSPQAAANPKLGRAPARGWPSALAVGLFDSAGGLAVALSRLPRDIIGRASAETAKVARGVIRRRWPGHCDLGDIGKVDDAAVDLLYNGFGAARGLVAVGARFPCRESSDSSFASRFTQKAEWLVENVAPIGDSALNVVNGVPRGMAAADATRDWTRGHRAEQKPWPRAAVQIKSWRWRVALSYLWRSTENGRINLLELKGVRQWSALCLACQFYLVVGRVVADDDPGDFPSRARPSSLDVRVSAATMRRYRAAPELDMLSFAALACASFDCMFRTAELIKFNRRSAGWAGQPAGQIESKAKRITAATCYFGTFLGSAGRFLKAAAKAAAGDTALEAFLSRGWEEAGLLGIGARGQVLHVRRRGCGGPGSALKLTSADEVRALQELSRNVVELEEAFTAPGPGEAWARLELLEGGSLRGLLRERRPAALPEDTARWVLCQVLQGLEDLHHAGWMHRDLKAENIGIREPPGLVSAPRVKLMDFDSAVRVPPRPEALADVIGTVENMAPEVFDGQYDERADCWSLGVVTYECLFGYRPFNDASVDRVEEMVRHWDRYLHFPSEHGVGRDARDLVQGLLQDRESRLSSAEALRHHWLQRERQSLTRPQQRPQPPQQKPQPPQQLEKRRLLRSSFAMPAMSARAGGADRCPSKSSGGTEYRPAPLQQLWSALKPGRSRKADEDGGGASAALGRASGSPAGSASSSSRPAQMPASPAQPSSPTATAARDEVSSLLRLQRSLSEWNAAQSQAPHALDAVMPAAVSATDPSGRGHRRSAASPLGHRRQRPPWRDAPAAMTARLPEAAAVAAAAREAPRRPTPPRTPPRSPQRCQRSRSMGDPLRAGQAPRLGAHHYAAPPGSGGSPPAVAPEEAEAAELAEMEHLRAVRERAQELMRRMSSQAPSLPPPPLQQEDFEAPPCPDGELLDDLAKDKQHLGRLLAQLQHDLAQAPRAAPL